jgi:MoxR-like ATPase
MRRFEGTDSYVATPDLQVAVNAAIALERPLLVKGEPGTGKTILAHEIARGIGRDLITWHIKSTTKAQHGLYEYDAVKRLRDGQLGDERVHDIRNYIVPGKLWEAFTADEAPVLLIDEIDRTDEAFEAFLLEVLGDFQITIPEMGTVKAASPPIVVITSNRTREVHDALKRRCLYHWVGYPTAERELQIVRTKVPGISKKLSDQVVGFVQQLRKQELFKSPGVAETLDWAAALSELDVVALDPATVSDTLGVLLKYQDDIAKLEGSKVKELLEEVRSDLRAAE